MLLQKPALSRTQIVFVYAGDLWTVPRDGGDAKRLTSGAGIETNPAFSPDGSQIAFTGEYDGNVDVFVIPAEGGVPKRLTWHPAADITLGWTPDGKRILFSSTRTSYSRLRELFTVGLEGGMAEKVDLPMGFEGAYSPDGTQLAYVPISRAFTAWKRYRGGQATPIWIATLATGHIEKVPREGSNDFNPMWAAGEVYFLSDRDGPVTLYAYDTRSKQVKRLLDNDSLDLKSASTGPGAIVYEQFGSLHLYDLKSGKTRAVNVRISGDMQEVREHFVNVGKKLHNAHISPTGARAVFEARGDIVTVPAEKGDARDVTNTTAVMERDPAWSPDGKTIAYFSDESGEYALHLRPQNGLGEVKKIDLGPGFYFAPRWSPDSAKIAYLDSHLALWYVDINAKKSVKVDKDRYWGVAALIPSWSPDSKWLAYSKRLESHLSAVCLYSTDSGQSTQLTDGMSDARDPVWDKDGKYLYFTASTDSGPSLEPDIHSAVRPVSRSVYLAVLGKDAPSPLAPESDDEKAVDEKKSPGKIDEAKADEVKRDDAKKDDAKEDAQPKVEVKIEFDNIGQRILALPLPPRRYVDLQVGKAGVLFALEAQPPGAGENGALTVHRFDLKTRKSDVAIGGVRSFEISLNGEKMLCQQGDKWVISAPKPMATGSGASPPPPPASDSDKTLKTEGIEVRVSPREEWKQMYREAWRIERDFFYDPKFHGLDLAATEKRYLPYLENVQSRADLNYLFSEMLGELTIGHLFVAGGDFPEVKHVETGLLGADYKIENGRYRFARVYNGENWNPEMKAPLTQPGVNVVAGDYLLAVGGREVRGADNIYSFFEGTAGKSVVLKVGPDASGANAREVTVVPVADEGGLRNLAWIEDNRRKVNLLTHGRVAYIYMPNTSLAGLTNFNRYFFAQVGKEAAIIDERFNGGGALATDIIEYLRRRLMSVVSTRDGADEMQPQGAIFGPKVMIINEFAGSGGDAMPWYFHRAGVGKLIGKRTWGGLVGRAFAPELMDGGFVSAPSSGVWNPDKGEWEVENRGIQPDVEVEFDPEAVRAGHDPQLEKAVEVVMQELEQNPVPHPKRPAYPNYHAQ
ncbi:MAG TPA: PDZ domain-containing protein [Bryobacteraceae bacterium]|nr:PDZ domain-containing protein [Bryobacteraceae bacterium]